MRPPGEGENNNKAVCVTSNANGFKRFALMPPAFGFVSFVSLFFVVLPQGAPQAA